MKWINSDNLFFLIIVKETFLESNCVKQIVLLFTTYLQWAIYRHCRLFYNQKLTLLVYADLETFTLPEHTTSSPDISGVCGVRSAVLCVVFCRSLFVLVLFLLTIVLSVLLRFVDSDYPFGIFKFFLHLKMIFRLLVFFSKGIQCIQFDWTTNKL